jgi:hypothetical protein
MKETRYGSAGRRVKNSRPAKTRKRRRPVNPAAGIPPRVTGRIGVAYAFIPMVVSAVGSTGLILGDG